MIYEVRPDDAGQYACVAINSVGKSTCTARLDVESECFCFGSFLLFLNIGHVSERKGLCYLAGYLKEMAVK